MKNPQNMNRTELKDLVRESGWSDEISLGTSTEELREFVSKKLDDSTAVVTPEPPSASDLAGPSPAPLATAESDEETPESAPSSKSAEFEKGAPRARSAPGTTHYRVERFSRWVNEGVVYQLRAGCFVSSATHPIDELRAQGVPLEEVAKPDDSDPGLGHRFA